MNAGFSADPEALARHAEKFGSLAERVREIHASLSESLGSLGQVWGTDEIGRGFADAHLPGAEATLDELGALPDRLSEMGANFGATAAGYRATDEDAAEDLGRAVGGDES